MSPQACFELQRQQSSFELRVHRLSLPGLTCPVCGETWSGTGTDYPLAGLAEGVDSRVFEDVSPVPLEEYQRRARSVVGVPTGCVLEPGSGIGALRGAVRGTVRDINIGFFNLVLKRDAFDALLAEGLRLAGAPILLRGGKYELIEVQVEPHARLSVTCLPGGKYPEVCKACGRIAIVVPPRVVLDAQTVPTHMDVFRGIDASTYIFVSERFRAACERRKLEGGIFVPIEVA